MRVCAIIVSTCSSCAVACVSVRVPWNLSRSLISLSDCEEDELDRDRKIGRERQRESDRQRHTKTDKGGWEFCCGVCCRGS